MKKLILSLAMLVSFVFVSAQTIAFESKVIDYGIIDSQRIFKFMELNIS